MMDEAEAAQITRARRSSIGRKARKRVRAICILLVGVTACLALVGAGWLAGFRINLTPSEPLGLWRILAADRPPSVGDLIFVCLPRDVAAVGLARGYLRPGLCLGGTAPLIKTVAAIGGAAVTIGTDVTLNGSLLPHSRLAAMDGTGRPLTAWQGGIVPAGGLYLHSDFIGSYDSRYFGSVPSAGVLGLARPLLTFDP